MKIENVSVKPMTQSYEPEFLVRIDYTYPSYITPIRFNGFLVLDGYRIAFLQEYQFNFGRSESLLPITSSESKQIKDHRIFVAPISRYSLSKLQEKRDANPKGEINFKLQIQFVCLESMYSAIIKKGDQKGIVFASLNDEGALLRTINHDREQTVTISGNDWIHEYSPRFEQTKYQVFEVPIPFVLNDASDFANGLNAAIHALQKMESAKATGDWEGVIKESRPLWELIRNNKQNIDDLFDNAGLNADTIVAFKETIKSLFDFTSKFIHRVATNGKLMPYNIASKEDAEFIFTLGISLINLITKKLKRSVT